MFQHPITPEGEFGCYIGNSMTVHSKFYGHMDIRTDIKINA